MIQIKQLAVRPLPTTTNKGAVQGVSCVTTVLDNDPAVGINDVLAGTPAGNPASPSYVGVFVNGIQVLVGDGVQTTPCYFAADAAGATAARTYATIQAGDYLHWVGSVAGFQLTAGVDFLLFCYDGP
jgi:hypothetical protein